MENEFSGSDPVLSALHRLARHPRWVYILAVVMNVLLSLIGLYYSLVLGSQKVVPVWESSALLQGLSVGLLASPAIWAYALWHPLALANILENLEKKGVIARAVSLPNTSVRKRISLRQLLHEQVVRKHWQYLSLVAMGVGVWLYSEVIVPAETLRLGRPSVFFAFPAIKFMYMIYVAPHIYLVALTILRTLVTVMVLTRFFSSPKAIALISIFDPDQSGGFGTIGQFSMGLGLFAVIIGWITATSTLHPVLAGGQANISATLIVSVFYIFLVPICIFVPIWSVHKAMTLYRDSQIQQLSVKANKTLKNILVDTWDDAAPSIKSLNGLEEMHKYIVRNTPTWPLAWPAIGGFSIAAVLPVLVNLMSIGVSLYRDKP